MLHQFDRPAAMRSEAVIRRPKIRKLRSNVCSFQYQSFVQVPSELLQSARSSYPSDSVPLLLGQKLQNGVVYLDGFFPHPEMARAGDESEFGGRNQASHLSGVLSVDPLVALAIQK